jgi:hypothetical protein
MNIAHTVASLRWKESVIAVVALSLFCNVSFAYIGSGTAGTANEEGGTIEQFGITWTFDRKLHKTAPDSNYYQYGTYANGDYWVYDSDGTVTITAIDPAKTTISQDGKTFTVDGSQVNPSHLGLGHLATGTKQGFDSRVTFFDDSVCVTAPLTLSGLNSLISCKSWRTTDPGCPKRYASTRSNSMYYSPRPALRYGAVLTTVATVPLPGAFRPAYCGTTTKITTHNTSQMNLTVLPSISSVGKAPFSRDWMEDMRRPWIQFLTAWPGECIQPSDNGVSYGRNYSYKVGDCALLLMLNAGTISPEQKETLAIQMIQVGIDTYGVIANGGGWGHIGGGIGQGRKLPILFAGIALDYAPYKNIGTTHGFNAKPELNHAYFQEDAQKFYITQDDIDRWGTTSKRVTRTNCSVSAADPTVVTDDDGGNWLAADDGTSKIQSRDNTLLDYWLVWNYDGPAPEYRRIRGINYKGVGPATLQLRGPVTPGTGKTVRVQLFPQGRLGYPDWSGGGSSDHWTAPLHDWESRTYRTCCTGNSLSAIELFALAVKTRDGTQTVKDLWNNPVFFDYMDSYMVDMARDAHPTASQRGPAWQQAMWDRYRKEYGVLWSEPTLELIGDKHAVSGTPLAFRVAGTDINGHALTYSIDDQSTGKGMTIQASSGAFSWTPDAGGKHEGPHTVAFTVTNEHHQSVHQAITITVSGPAKTGDPGNRPKPQ